MTTNKIIIVSGKRKSAIARAVVRAGTGIVMVNNTLLDQCSPKIAMMLLQEPLLLAGEGATKVDIEIDTRGGGIMGQAEAARLAMAKGLVAFLRDKKLEKAFLEYDRHMLVADVRRKEVRKPNRHGKARAAVQKSYR
ncbi:TPA: 30S ribosomal protein S9 [Candidatus Woesearchaeota archaeon]|nr:30S ribosomal protein S9 [Candidatus Woesearchaeota archaeon]